MIKAVFQVKGRKIVLLGLTAENITRLQDGKPIAFNGNVLGLGDITVSICYGETTEAITTNLTADGLMDHIVATPADPGPVLQPAPSPGPSAGPQWSGAGLSMQTTRDGGPGTA